MSSLKKDSSSQILLFPGFGMAGGNYKRFKDLASPKHEIEFVDYEKLIPHGDTSLLAERLHEQHKERSPRIVVGHSLGGALAMEYALKHPERVQKLLLANPVGLLGEESFTRVFGGWSYNNFVYGLGNFTQEVESFLRVMRKPKLYFNLAMKAYKTYLAEELKELSVPATIFWGERDALFTVRQAMEFDRLIPESQFIVLDRQGHDWIIEDPKHLLEHL